MNKGSLLLSKRLERKWDEKMQVEHRQRVHLAQKTINMESPPQFLHLEQNLKRQQQDEEKYTEIERNNRILMQKMAVIIQNKETFQQRNLTGFRSISPKGHFFTQKEKRENSKKSLNYEKRLREHKQIITENHQMLKRLQGKQSTFDVVKWHRDEVDRQRMLNNMKKNIWEEKIHKNRMESTLTGPIKAKSGLTPFNSTMMSVKNRGGVSSARRYNGGSTLMSKTANQHLYQKKNSSFHASRAIDQIDQYSNEAHPYQQQQMEANADDQNQSKASAEYSNEPRDQRSRTVEANFRNKKEYRMPLSKHIGKHVYRGKDPNSQLVLKRSLQGEGPMRLEKINHEIRIRQEPMGTADATTRRSNKASLPPLQMQADKSGKRAKRDSSPGFHVDRSSNSPPGGTTRRNKTAANLGGARTGHASQRHGSPSKRQEALLFQIQIQMRERDVATRCDVSYPYERKDQDGKILEVQAEPSNYDIQFIYQKGKKTNPLFRIFGQRIDKEDEQYEIDIVGHKRIKGVMEQFDHEYMQIVDNLRIMGDALVLLNPVKNQQTSMQITNQSDSKIEAQVDQNSPPVGEDSVENHNEEGQTDEASRTMETQVAGQESLQQNNSVVNHASAKERESIQTNQIKIQDEVQAEGAKTGDMNNQES